MARQFRLSALVLSVLAVTGCSTVSVPIMQSASVPEELYLRGVFTWWEADEDYRLKETGSDVFSTTVELVADGQPYDFRFADQDWTKGANCGYENASSDKIIELNQNVNATCDDQNNHFQFTPSVTDRYRFTIDFTDPDSPEVTVSKV